MRSAHRTTRLLTSVAATMMLCRALSCSGAQEFRSVAGGDIKTGVQTIASAVIDGLFAVIEPDSTDTTTDDTGNNSNSN